MPIVVCHNVLHGGQLPISYRKFITDSKCNLRFTSILFVNVAEIFPDSSFAMSTSTSTLAKLILPLLFVS